MLKTIFLIVLLLSLVGAKKKVKIGAIFDEGPDGDAWKKVLQLATKRLNVNNQVDFVDVIRQVSPNDSYKAKKIACQMIEDDNIQVLFGPGSFMTSSIIRSIANRLQIPHFLSTSNPSLQNNEEFTTVLNLLPKVREFGLSVAELLKEMHWSSYTIIYEDIEHLIELERVLEIHNRNSLPISIKQLIPGSDYRILLKEIHASGELNIILACRMDKILPILTLAKEVNMLQDYHSYIITSLDAVTLNYSQILNILPNITSIRLVDPGTAEIQTLFNDLFYEDKSDKEFLFTKSMKVSHAIIFDALQLFSMVLNEMDIYDELGKERVSCRENRVWSLGQEISKYMKLKVIKGLTGQIKFQKDGQRVDSVFEIVELNTDGFKKTATWDHEKGISFMRSEQELYTQIVENINKKMFRVASKIGPPYLMLKKSNSGEILKGNDRFEGYVIDLIDSISKILNLTYEFYLVPDRRYGSYNPKTKQWDGLMKELITRNADLAVCDLTITYERRTAVDFTMPFMTLGISILYKKALKQPPGLFSFSYPLSLDVWMYTATAYMIVTLTLVLLSRMCNKEWQNPHPCDSENNELENIWNFNNCFWLMLGSVMAQGSDILPKGYPTRIITSFWWAFSLIILSTYTANLAAFLTMERMDSTISSIYDLAEQSKVKYGTVSGGSTSYFFQNSNNSVHQRIWTTMESTTPSVFTRNNQEGIERVQKSKRNYAFIMESTSIEYATERYCNLEQVGGWLDSKGYGIAMPINSPYRTAISGAVLKLQEEGTLYSLKKKWWSEMHNEGQCLEKMSSARVKNELEYWNVAGVFVVLYYGLAFAFCLSIFEFLWNVRKVAVDEKMTLWEAFIVELKFACQIYKTTKPSRPSLKKSSSACLSSETETATPQSTCSLTQNVLKTANSILKFELFNNNNKEHK